MSVINKTFAAGEKLAATDLNSIVSAVNLNNSDLALIIEACEAIIDADGADVSSGATSGSKPPVFDLDDLEDFG